jgi:hypothetical protein
MADVATPSGAAMFDAGNTEKKEKTGKPTAPDEAAYKAALAKAEKDHAAAMERFVGCPFFPSSPSFLIGVPLTAILNRIFTNSPLEG